MSKNLEQLVHRLRATLGKIEVAIGAMVDSVVWTNRQGEVQWCNQSFDALVGRRHLEMLGSPLISLLPLRQNNKEVLEKEHPFNLIFADQPRIERVYEFQRKGCILVLEIFAVRVNIDQKDVSGVFVIQDITERKRIEKEIIETRRQLAQNEKMASIGTLSSGLAHEIKNPLAVILEGNERVEEIFNEQKDARGLRYATMIRNAALRADKIIGSLLQFSRFSSIEKKPLLLHRVLDSALDLINTKAEEFAVKIFKQYTADNFFIDGDYIVLQQVFFNLFTNAIDAMEGGGEIRIVTALDEAAPLNKGLRAIVKICDTGKGLTKEELSRIFDPFFTTKAPGKGTGLGLSLVYMLLDRHNGGIEVESQQGEGTTFTVALPIIEV